MAEQPKKTVAILFADICESTPLYSDKTDEIALAMVETCLDGGAAIVAEEGGQVVRSKGDDLLCTFGEPGAALRAARRMVTHQLTEPVQLRVGIHSGEAIRARNDIFGEAVNVAARVLGVARPNEVVVTADVHRKLAWPDREDLESLGHHFLKGMVAPLELFKVVADDDARTVFGRTRSTTTDLSSRRKVSSVALTFGERRLTCTEESPPVTMGRLAGCDLLVTDPRVSRHHAEVEVRGGKAILVDHSTRGTWVRSPGGEIHLHRESLFLVGTGSIFLVGSGDRDPAAGIAYEVVEESGPEG